MGWVTKEQIERAKQIDVLDYIQKTESQNIKRVGREYRLKDHPSLAVSPGKWYWHSHKIGGKGYKLIETKAPDGYELDHGENVFGITEQGVTVELTAINEKIPEKPRTPQNPGSPKTGDDRNPALWLAIMGAAMAGLVLTLRRRKKTFGIH